jgi:hypothetical protein
MITEFTLCHKDGGSGSLGWYLCTRPDGIPSRKAVIFIFAAVNTSNLVFYFQFCRIRGRVYEF